MGAHLLSHAAVRAIERYRRSDHPDAGCRFHPSCSEFALEAFRTRAAPVALLMTGLRLLRCNPLATRRMVDPVVRSGRRPRGNTLPTGFAIAALSGLVVVITAGVAQAVGVSGGCTASINGRQAATLTSSDPLVVHKGETVAVTGVAPPSVQSLPPNQVSSNTHVDVSIVEGVFGVSSSDHAGHGPSWGGNENVDSYLKYGVGLYKVTGVANGTPGWSCSGSGYVKLSDGNPLGKPIGQGAAALAVLGAAGAALAAHPRGEPEPTSTMDLDDEEALQAPANTLDGFFGMGCFAFLLAAMAGTKGIAASLAMATPRAPRRRVWVRGHAVSGFIGGLLVGLGGTVLAQQFAYWPLNIATAIVFPIVCGLICGLRAWMGRPWTVAG